MVALMCVLDVRWSRRSRRNLSMVVLIPESNGTLVRTGRSAVVWCGVVLWCAVLCCEVKLSISSYAVGSGTNIMARQIAQVVSWSTIEAS